METHNIISTPAITGNIGSCSSQSVRILNKSSFFREYGTNIVTNSCTGEVQNIPYLDNSIIGGGFLIAVALVLGIVFGIACSNDSSSDYDY